MSQVHSRRTSCWLLIAGLALAAPSAASAQAPRPGGGEKSDPAKPPAKGIAEPAKDKDSEKTKGEQLAAKAWLRLAQELHQDAFFRFKPTSDRAIQLSTTGDATAVNAKSEVDPQGGNKGEITVRLVFDSSGQFQSAEEKSNFRAGVR